MKRLLIAAVILVAAAIALLVLRSEQPQTYAPSLPGRTQFGFSDNGNPGRLTVAQYQFWLASLRVSEGAIQRQIKRVNSQLLRIERSYRTGRRPSGRTITRIRALQAKQMRLAQQELGIRAQERQARFQASQRGGSSSSQPC